MVSSQAIRQLVLAFLAFDQARCASATNRSRPSTGERGDGRDKCLPEEKYKLAYDAAILTLTQQDATLGNLRNRATGLFTVAALITSFSSTIGLINKDHPWPIGVLLGLLGTLAGVGVCAMWILLPKSQWNFGPVPEALLEYQGDEQSLRRAAVLGMVDAREENKRAIQWSSRLYVAGSVFLLCETGLVVAAVIVYR